jgi:hypothetical protein
LAFTIERENERRPERTALSVLSNPLRTDVTEVTTINIGDTSDKTTRTNASGSNHPMGGSKLQAIHL